MTTIMRTQDLTDAEILRKGSLIEKIFTSFATRLDGESFGSTRDMFLYESRRSGARFVDDAEEMIYQCLTQIVMSEMRVNEVPDFKTFVSMMGRMMRDSISRLIIIESLITLLFIHYAVSEAKGQIAGIAMNIDRMVAPTWR